MFTVEVGVVFEWKGCSCHVCLLINGMEGLLDEGTGMGVGGLQDHAREMIINIIFYHNEYYYNPSYVSSKDVQPLNIYKLPMDVFPLLGDDNADNNDKNDYPRGYSYSCSTRETSCNFFPGHDEVFGHLRPPVVCDPLWQQQEGSNFESPS